jgi:hypothetical protein
MIDTARRKNRWTRARIVSFSPSLFGSRVVVNRRARSTRTLDAFVPISPHPSSTMMSRCTFAFILLALTGAIFPPSAHESSLLSQQKAIGELSSEQRRAIQLLISTDGTSSGFSSSEPRADKLIFKVGEPAHVGIVMTNTAIESVKVCAFSNSYYQNRPQLTRDGQALGYSKKIADLIRQSDLGLLCEFTRTPDIVDLKPNVRLRVPSIQLQEWYGPLTQGHYKLLLKRTFACCADGLLKSSNETSFDIIP